VNKPTLALLWDSHRRAYVAIRKFGDEWFVVSELGIDYDRAKNALRELNND
jgi:hypothetical protein